MKLASENIKSKIADTESKRDAAQTEAEEALERAAEAEAAGSENTASKEFTRHKSAEDLVARLDATLLTLNRQLDKAIVAEKEADTAARVQAIIDGADKMKKEWIPILKELRAVWDKAVSIKSDHYHLQRFDGEIILSVLFNNPFRGGRYPGGGIFPARRIDIDFVAELDSIVEYTKANARRFITLGH